MKKTTVAQLLQQWFFCFSKFYTKTNRMKKGIFTLLLFAIAQLGISQTTYYWVGGNTQASFTSGSNWNTTLGGGGTSPASLSNASNQGDIFIFDGSNLGPSSTGFTVDLTGVSGTPTIGQLKFVNFADVSMKRATSGTFTLRINGNLPDDDLHIDQFSRMRLHGDAGSVAVILQPTATGKVEGQYVAGPNNNQSGSTAQNRLVSLSNGALRFKAGSLAMTEANYGYAPFGSAGSSASPAAGGGVVFEAGSRYIHNAGGSPFGTSSTSSLATFLPGSKYIFRAPANGSVHFNNRSFPDVYVENNTTLTLDGTPARFDSLVITTGSTLVTDSTSAFPIAGHLVVDGTFSSPAAGAERDNKVSFVGAAPQNISGTGTISLTDIYISNQSNVTLQRPITVDSLIMVVGTFNPNGNAINGNPSVIIKPAASLPATGSTTDSSFVVGVTDLTDVQIGMSVTGAGIPANSVITNMSTSNSTITISNRATATATGVGLTIFNGQGTILPVKFGAVSATLENGATRILWNVLQEENISRYLVERSFNGSTFSEIGSVKADLRSAYNFTDANPAAGTNFYRIVAIGRDGQTEYSDVMRVNNASGKASFSVYPNPVKGNKVNLQLNNVAAGNYNVRLINLNGQTVYNERINVSGTSFNQSFVLPAGVKGGIYTVNVVGENANLLQRIVVE